MVLMAIDGPSVARRLYHSHSDPRPLVDVWAERIRLLARTHQPDRWLCGWDSYEDSWRKALYPRYKSNRGGPPKDYLDQLKDVGAWSAKYGLPVISARGNEADDILGAVAEQAVDTERVILVSDDKDLRQCVMRPNVTLVTLEGKVWDRQTVRDEMGVWPNDLADYYAIAGDRADNIPGAWMVGERRTRKIIYQHRTLEKAMDAKETNIWDNGMLLRYRDLMRLNTKIDVMPALAPVPDDMRRVG